MSTGLSLEEFREVIGYNPWHFWQLTSTEFAKLTSNCNSLVRKYSWQAADSEGREDISKAIESAEKKLAGYFGYYPCPHFAEHTLAFPRYHQPDVYRLGYAGSDGRWLPIILPEGKVIKVGIEAYTAIETDATVVYSDEDNDGFEETFKLTAPIPAGMSVSEDEVAVYFSQSDRVYEEALSEKWRVRPVSVAISGGSVTVKGRAWTVVQPVLYEGAEKEEIDPLDIDNFVHTLDIYRHYTDTEGLTYSTSQAALVWETNPYPLWAFSPSAPVPANVGDPAAQAYALARVGIRQADTGTVALSEAVYNATSSQWTAIPWYWSGDNYRPPDRVIVRYYAGYPFEDNGQRMSTRMKNIVARMAIAEMPRRICACDSANKEIYHWQFDLARTVGSGDEAYGAIAREDLANPFGTRRGHVHAWQEVRNMRVLKGFSV